MAPNDIRALIESNLEDTTIADRVLEALRPHHGKQINKRMATAVGKALPEYTVHYDSAITMYHLHVWGSAIEYNRRKSFLLGYYSDTTFDVGLYESRFNVCWYSAARERNEKRRALMTDSGWLAQVADAINVLNATRERYAELVTWEIPDRYDFEKLIEAP
jgi:hypothetical protein